MSTDLPVVVENTALVAQPLVDVSILAGQLAPASIAMYRRDFAAYVHYAGSAAAALNPATLNRWRAQLATETKHSPHTINRMISAVKRVMKEASKQGYVAGELAEQFKQVDGVKVAALKERLKPHRRVKITPTDMRRLCNAPDEGTLVGKRDRALLEVLASSGLRVATAATLTLGQIVKRSDGYMLSVRSKNEIEYREVPLSQAAYKLVMDWIAARPFASETLFTSFAGRGRPVDKPLTAVSAWRVVQRYADACELSHIKPHDFRRFVGTQIASKYGERKAQKILGHKNINTTIQHYVLDELETGLTDNLF